MGPLKGSHSIKGCRNSFHMVYALEKFSSRKKYRWFSISYIYSYDTCILNPCFNLPIKEENYSSLQIIDLFLGSMSTETPNDFNSLCAK